MYLIKNRIQCHKDLNFNIQYKDHKAKQTKADNSDVQYRNIFKALAYKCALRQRGIESPLD